MRIVVDRWSAHHSLSERQRELLFGFGRFASKQLREQCENLDPEQPIEHKFITCLLLEGNQSPA